MRPDTHKKKAPVKTAREVAPTASTGGGKRERKAIAKNNDLVTTFLYLVENAGTRMKFAEDTTREALQLGRVLRGVGGGRFEVQLMDPTITEPVKLSLKGSIHGRRGLLRGDKSHSVCAGDVVIIDGGQIGAKVPVEAVSFVADHLRAMEVEMSRDFFPAHLGGDSGDEGNFVFVGDEDESPAAGGGDDDAPFSESEPEIDIDRI